LSEFGGFEARFADVSDSIDLISVNLPIGRRVLTDSFSPRLRALAQHHAAATDIGQASVSRERQEPTPLHQPTEILKQLCWSEKRNYSTASVTTCGQLGRWACDVFLLAQ